MCSDQNLDDFPEHAHEGEEDDEVNLRSSVPEDFMTPEQEEDDGS